MNRTVKENKNRSNLLYVFVHTAIEDWELGTEMMLIYLCNTSTVNENSEQKLTQHSANTNRRIKHKMSGQKKISKHRNIQRKKNSLTST